MATSNLIIQLKEQLDTWKPTSSEQSIGTVERIADGIALISGLPQAKAGELLHIP